MIDSLIKKKLINRVTSIELVVSDKCQNSCLYCYRVRYHKRSNIVTVPIKYLEVALHNTFKLFPDLEKVKEYELFGGDALIDYEYASEVLRFVSNYADRVLIPTNFRLLYSLTSQDLVRLLDLPLKVGISISVDADFTQRPLSKFGRMMAYPEKMSLKRIISHASILGAGFHPMLSFRNSDKWLNQVKMFIDRNIEPYLLEVRHPLSLENIYLALEQISKIRIFLAQKYDSEGLKKFNTISPSRTPRGLSCSALTTFTIMPDGSYPFCHRLIEPAFCFGNAYVGDVDYDKAISLFTFDHRNAPDCLDCSIRLWCGGGCCGAQYEYWRVNAWAPIPSVCQYQKSKRYIFGSLFEDWSNSLGKALIKTIRDDLVSNYGKGYVEKLDKLIDMLQTYTPPPIEDKTNEDVFVS